MTAGEGVLVYFEVPESVLGIDSHVGGGPQGAGGLLDEHKSRRTVLLSLDEVHGPCCALSPSTVMRLVFGYAISYGAGLLASPEAPRLAFDGRTQLDGSAFLRAPRFDTVFNVVDGRDRMFTAAAQSLLQSTDLLGE